MWDFGLEKRCGNILKSQRSLVTGYTVESGLKRRSLYWSLPRAHHRGTGRSREGTHGLKPAQARCSPQSCFCWVFQFLNPMLGWATHTHPHVGGAGSGRQCFLGVILGKAIYIASWPAQLVQLFVCGEGHLSSPWCWGQFGSSGDSCGRFPLSVPSLVSRPCFVCLLWASCHRRDSLTSHRMNMWL